jgi:hypothetical protein
MDSSMASWVVLGLLQERLHETFHEGFMAASWMAHSIYRFMCGSGIIVVWFHQTMTKAAAWKREQRLEFENCGWLLGRQSVAINADGFLHEIWYKKGKFSFSSRRDKLSLY